MYVLPPDGSVAEQSTVPASTPALPEDPELPDEPEPAEELEELPGAPEEASEGRELEPELTEDDPSTELLETEVDADPSPPPVEEWLDDEHAASATTAALRKRYERSLMERILPRSAGRAFGRRRHAPVPAAETRL